MKYPPHQLPSVLLTTLLLSLCCCGQLPPNQFHGRAQPSSLDSFFERALGLVNEVSRLLSTAENDEDVFEYCIARLENLLTNCVNLFRIIEEQQYNCVIDTVKTFLFISDSDLDQLIRNIRSHFPRIGCRQMRAMLEADHGLRIQRCRVRMAMRRVDPAGAAIRWSGIHVRRRYNVYGANALWHIDTHHSLVRWRLVVAGGIDGYSHLITYLQCFNNNRASTVVQCFYEGTRQYGFPSRVRSDRGGENYLVSILMCMIRGANRGSLIAGRSVHNQRIERLWRDVFWFCISTFYFFYFTSWKNWVYLIRLTSSTCLCYILYL